MANLAPDRAAMPRTAPPSTTTAPVRHTYRLKFPEEGLRSAKEIEFDAPDAAEALVIAHSEARRSSAELWRDGKKLCTIRRDGEVWQIG
jgi:hypothetical protein